MLRKDLPGLRCGEEHLLKKSGRRQRPKLAPEVRMNTPEFIIPVLNVKSKRKRARSASYAAARLGARHYARPRYSQISCQTVATAFLRRTYILPISRRITRISSTRPRPPLG